MNPSTPTSQTPRHRRSLTHQYPLETLVSWGNGEPMQVDDHIAPSTANDCIYPNHNPYNPYTNYTTFLPGQTQTYRYHLPSTQAPPPIAPTTPTAGQQGHPVQTRRTTSFSHPTSVGRLPMETDGLSPSVEHPMPLSAHYSVYADVPVPGLAAHPRELPASDHWIIQPGSYEPQSPLDAYAHSASTHSHSHSDGEPSSTPPIDAENQEQLNRFLAESFPEGTENYKAMRHRLAMIMQTIWKLENRIEEDENDLLQFTSKEEHIWRCLFHNKKGKQCECCQSRKIQALEHIRRHIKHEPFVCAGEPCRKSESGCGHRYSSPDPLRKHRAEKVECGYCRKLVLPGNLKRHQANNCHDA